MADLETAIQRYQKALDNTPDDHPDRARRLESLGTRYGNRYQRTKVIANLETAIQRYQEALDNTPNNHPNRARRLESLGTRYKDKYQRTEAMANLETTIQQFQEALDNSLSYIPVRLQASINLLKLHTEANNWSLTYQAAFARMYLISLLTSRFLENANKQNLFVRVVGLTSNATAVALIARKTRYEAIQFLEVGRDVILGSLNEMRVDISDL